MTDGEPRASNGAATNGNARDNDVTTVPPAASHPTAPEGDNFPVYPTCIISGEPLAQAVYFNVPCATGYYDLYRKVCHPIYNSKIVHLVALSVVTPVPANIQARCARERQLLGLPSSVDPLTTED